VLGREPTRTELAKVMERRIEHLYQTVAESDEYRVLEGVEELLPRMLEEGYLLGLVTGNVEAAAHIKLHRARLNRFFSYHDVAGIPCVGVASHHFTTDQLRAAGADHVIESLVDGLPPL
jgi:phosphoglycolate phosphatase-like HAD superfamily hydrolase